MMFVIMMEQSRQSSTSPESASSPASLPTPFVADNKPVASKPKMGGELPKIVRQFGAAPTAETPAKMPGRLQAPDLSSLLGRLEDKVKSDPANIGNRLLLAQTYNELGLGDKAVNEVRAALVQAPDHARAQLVLASILSARQNEADLNEAKALLDGLKLNVKIKQYLVAMYLGDAFIRLGEHDEALKNWKQALETMPPTDNRRAQIEKRIADMSAASSKSSG
jgi:cytochrome c-type biogenesis protein CcmH/NrfG